MAIKVRFNLGRGKNYMTWKVSDGDSVNYYNPNEVNISMINARLRNHKKTSRSIFNGSNKSVCAWVLCDELTITKLEDLTEPIKKGVEVRFNPRVTPNWEMLGDNVDGLCLNTLTTKGRKIYSI